jgi:Cdc6-like AAA superfamily ATPase
MALKRDEIKEAVEDPEWQKFRAGLKGLPTEQKLVQLDHYQAQHDFSDASRTAAENYKNALKRAGQIPGEGEKEEK